MLNTNDGYAYASGVKELLSHHVQEDFLYAHTALAKLGFLLCKLGFAPPNVELFLPAVLSSLVVVPVFLTGCLIKRPFLGLIAALLSCVAQSYYNRTMIGYFDTDMLVIVLASFNAYLLLRVLKKCEFVSVVLAFACNLLYIYWYPQSFSLLLANSFIFLVLFIIKSRTKELFFLCFALCILSLLGISIWLKLALFALLVFIYFAKKRRLEGLFCILLASLACIFIIIAFYLNQFDQILSQLGFYLTHSTKASKLVFYDVSSTIQEASSVDLLEFMQRISSSAFAFLLSIIGLVWLFVRYPNTLVFLPSLCLGLLSFKAGLRFSIYAVVPCALGFGAFACFVFERMRKNRHLLASLLCIMALIPSMLHIYEYKVPTVFSKSEVEFLQSVRFSKHDYILAWWDYGYLLRFFTNARTLIDGGKHLGEDNYFISYIFSNKLKQAVLMSKLAVNDTLFSKDYKASLARLIKRLGAKNTSDFLSALKASSPNIEKAVKAMKKPDIYLYLPYKMLDILNVVYAFANIDFIHPKEQKALFYFKANATKIDDDYIYLDNGVLLASDFKSMKLGKMDIAFNGYYVIKSIKKGDFEFIKSSEKSPLVLIYVQNTGDFLVMDESIFNSSFIQLLLFNNYDKSLVKEIRSQDEAKIFKLL